MAQKTSYLVFEEQPNTTGRRTLRFTVKNTYGHVLGQILYATRWRKYVFESVDRCIFDAGCLNEITAKLDSLMEERKNRPPGAAEALARKLSDQFLANRQYTGQR